MNEDMSPDSSWDPAEWDLYQAEIEQAVTDLNLLLDKYKSETIRSHLAEAIDEIASYTEWEESDEGQAEAA